MRSAVRSTLWRWVKVLLCLAALDWAFFGGGALFFRAVPELPRFPVTWGLLYRCVQRIALPLEAPRAYAVGSSIVFLGLDERRVRDGMAERAVPGTFTALTVFGTSGVDIPVQSVAQKMKLCSSPKSRSWPWLTSPRLPSSPWP